MPLEQDFRFRQVVRQGACCVDQMPDFYRLALEGQIRKAARQVLPDVDLQIDPGCTNGMRKDCLLYTSRCV